MAKPPSDERPGLLGHPPEEVRVTITMLPRRRTAALRRRLADIPARARTGVVIGMLVVAVALVALGMTALLGGLGRAAPSEHRARAQRAVAYVRRCPSALAGLSRASLRHDFNRAVWCARYAGRAAANPYRFIGAPLPAFDSSGG